MLTIIAVGTDGRRHSLSAPESLLLCIDELTPAVSLNAVFSGAISSELCEIHVYDDKELVYSGIVDEQITCVGETVKTEIVSRSMAALLIDNEALPVTFVNPSAELLFRKYLKPLGITGYKGKNAVLFGEFKVAKGTSCWQVMEDFCRESMGSFPRVEGSDLYLEGARNDREVVIDNSPQGEFCYTSLEHNKLRCKPISRVRAKVQTGGDYSVIVENKDSVSRGIVRERYLNATELSSYSLSQAQEMIDSSVAASESVVLHCPKRLTGLLGVGVTVRCSATGELKGLYVSGLRYSLTQKGESTKLILKKKEN